MALGLADNAGNSAHICVPRPGRALLFLSLEICSVFFPRIRYDAMIAVSSARPRRQEEPTKPASSRSHFHLYPAFQVRWASSSFTTRRERSSLEIFISRRCWLYRLAACRNRKCREDNKTGSTPSTHERMDRYTADAPPLRPDYMPACPATPPHSPAPSRATPQTTTGLLHHELVIRQPVIIAEGPEKFVSASNPHLVGCKICSGDQLALLVPRLGRRRRFAQLWAACRLFSKEPQVYRLTSQLTLTRQHAGHCPPVFRPQDNFGTRHTMSAYNRYQVVQSMRRILSLRVPVSDSDCLLPSSSALVGQCVIMCVLGTSILPSSLFSLFCIDHTSLLSTSFPSDSLLRQLWRLSAADGCPGATFPPLTR